MPVVIDAKILAAIFVAMLMCAFAGFWIGYDAGLRDAHTEITSEESA